MEIKDKFGKNINVGDFIAVAYRYGNSSIIEGGPVTEIKIKDDGYSFIYFEQADDSRRLRKVAPNPERIIKMS